jgi:hypothetical protein
MKYLYTLFALLTFNYVFVQSYIPFPESNAVWIQGSFLYSAYNNHEHATITQPLSFGNDSIVDGNTYHSLFGHTIADWIDGWGNQQTYQQGTDLFPNQLQVLFRQDIQNKKIYQWDNSTNQEQILYDFSNLVVGQPYPSTLNNLNFPEILVLGYDSLLLNDGVYHERWILGSNSMDSGFVSIIEGVGSTMGFDLPIAIPFEQSSATLCFSINGTPVYEGWANTNGLIPARYSEDCSKTVNISTLYPNDLNVSVWPNPFNDKIQIKSNERIVNLHIYNLIGQLVLIQEVQNLLNTELSLSNLPVGTYILKIFTDNNHIITKSIVH